MTRIALSFILLLSFALPTQAEKVFQYTDESGNTVFTDEPVKGAKEIEVKPVATIPAVPVPKTAPAPAEEEAFKYTSIKITSPENEQYFINNPDPVQVAVAIKPSLAAGHLVQLYFNGLPKGEPKAGNVFTFNQMDRGEYRTHASIVDKDGKEVGKSDTITFFVKRQVAPRPMPVKPGN